MPWSKEEVDKAIEDEARGWAAFYQSENLEARKRVMRANCAVGYFDPLLPYLPGGYCYERS